MNLTRRAVLQNLGCAAAAAMAVVLPCGRAPAADETAHLDVKDPAALAQGYVEHAAAIDVNCENCLLLQGKPGNNYRPCSLFPGKLVSVSGWCKGWTAEM